MKTLKLTLLAGLFTLLSTSAWAQMTIPKSGGDMSDYNYVAHVYVKSDDVKSPKLLESSLKFYADGFDPPGEKAILDCNFGKDVDTGNTTMDCEMVLYFKDYWRIDDIRKNFKGRYMGEADGYVAISDADIMMEVQLLMITPSGGAISKSALYMDPGAKTPKKFTFWHDALVKAEQLQLASGFWGKKEFIERLSAWDPSFKGILCKFWDRFEKFKINFKLIDPKADKDHQMLIFVSESRHTSGFKDEKGLACQ
jgi:hypothetical protein